MRLKEIIVKVWRKWWDWSSRTQLWYIKTKFWYTSYVIVHIKIKMRCDYDYTCLPNVWTPLCVLSLYLSRFLWNSYHKMHYIYAYAWILKLSGSVGLIGHYVTTPFQNFSYALQPLTMNHIAYTYIYIYIYIIYPVLIFN